VLLGFPGAGGVRKDGAVRYLMAPSQPTSIGELDGSETQRIQDIAQALCSAGFPVTVRPNMDAWLKTHVALVSPIANALYATNGDIYRLARTRDALVLLIRAVREGFRVLDDLCIPITPARLRVLQWIPEPVLVAVLQHRLPTEQAELALAGHANAARDEMRLLADEFQALARRSGLPTPALDRLHRFSDPARAPFADGSARLSQDWRGLVAAAGALLTLLLLLLPPRRR
jgi:2-dehydropantoate 2-reductase